MWHLDTMGLGIKETLCTSTHFSRDQQYFFGILQKIGEGGDKAFFPSPCFFAQCFGSQDCIWFENFNEGDRMFKPIDN